MPDHVTSLSGPVESIDGRLVLQIPLAAGGDQFVAASRGIGVVIDDYLEVTIPEWLARQLDVAEGTVVTVDNRRGKLNITPQSAG